MLMSPSAAKKLSFEQARQLEARKSPVPRFLTLQEVGKAVSGKQPSSKVFLVMSGGGTRPVAIGTVKDVLADLKEMKEDEFPQDTAAYVVRRQKGEQFHAWPVIWAGSVSQKLTLVAYCDPARFGFPSRSEGVITIGPRKAMKTEERSIGLWIRGERGKRALRFAPMGEQYTARALASRFGAHWSQVLDGYLALVPVEKGKQRRYEATKRIPNSEEYQELERKAFTKTIAAMINEAYGIMEELGLELSEAFENMPESLQGTDLGVDREEAAYQCTNVADDKPEVPEIIKNIEVFRRPILKQTSRRMQAKDVIECLEAIHEHVARLAVAKKKEVAAFLHKILKDADYIDVIDFPGMFG